MSLRLTARDTDALRAVFAGNERALDDYLAGSLQLMMGGAVCEPVEVRRVPASDGFAGFGWRARCPAAGPAQVRSRLLDDVVAAHVHLATVRMPDGETQAFALSLGADSTPILTEDPPRASGLLDFARTGFAHILSGWDHLIFLLALLVGLTSLGRTAAAVTGFTVGHSVTLAIVALGWARPNVAAVEALIGLSIVVLAVEAVWLVEGSNRRAHWAWLAALVGLTGLSATSEAVPVGAMVGITLFVACQWGLSRRAAQPERWRGLIATLFGLLHGLGFAGALASMPLPEGHRVVSLAGFNLGVEAGQLLALLIAWPALAGLERIAGRRSTRLAIGALTAGFGAYWFVQRAWV